MGNFKVGDIVVFISNYYNNSNSYFKLTKYKSYKVLQIDYESICVICDGGFEHFYEYSYFINIKKFRNSTIEDILR